MVDLVGVDHVLDQEEVFVLEAPSASPSALVLDRTVEASCLCGVFDDGCHLTSGASTGSI
jgi:hypothetical protein